MVKLRRFNLNLTAEQYEQFYTGCVTTIVARCDDGLRLAFPASALRSHVTQQGVQGRFEIVFDEQHRLVQLRKVS